MTALEALSALVGSTRGPEITTGLVACILFDTREPSLAMVTAARQALYSLERAGDAVEANRPEIVRVWLGAMAEIEEN